MFTAASTVVEIDKKHSLSLVPQNSSNSPVRSKERLFEHKENIESKIIQVQEASFIAVEMSIEMTPSEFEADTEEEQPTASDLETLKKIDIVLVEHYVSGQQLTNARKMVRDKVVNGDFSSYEQLRSWLFTKIIGQKCHPK